MVDTLRKETRTTTGDLLEGTRLLRGGEGWSEGKAGQRGRLLRGEGCSEEGKAALCSELISVTLKQFVSTFLKIQQ